MPFDSSIPPTLATAVLQDADHFRRQAERALRLSISINDRAATEALASLAKDYDEIAEDLETGASKVRHAELMSQRKS